MPALPSVPKVLKLVYQGVMTGGAKWVVGDFFGFTGSNPTNAELATFLSAVASAYTTNIAPLMTADRELTLLDVIDLTSSTSAAAELGVSIFGTRSDVALGAQIAYILKKEIFRRYRGGHPKQYWPIGGDTALADATHWGSAFVTAAQAGFLNQLTAIEAAGWAGAGTIDTVSVSYFEGFTNVLYPSGRYRAVPTRRVTPFIDNVSGYAHNPLIGTQRRRTEQSS